MSEVLNNITNKKKDSGMKGRIILLKYITRNVFMSQTDGSGKR